MMNDRTTNGHPILTETPAWAHAKWEGNKLLNEHEAPLWSGKSDVPAVGAYVDIAGPKNEVATVLGYYVADGTWLMLWCERHSDGKRGDLAGTEIRA